MKKQSVLLAVVLLVPTLLAVSGCGSKNQDQGTVLSNDAQQLKQVQQAEMDRLKNDPHLSDKAKATALNAVANAKLQAARNAPPPPPPMR